MEDITKNLEKKRGPKNAASLLTWILENLHEKMEPTLDLIEEQLDLLEKNVSQASFIDKTREDLLELRQEIIKDEINSLANEKMNRAMYMLSIVTGIFLPLGFLTGLLGINVGGMPRYAGC
jgi:Mg2+ and Co2+ transporter CorA